jgi:heptosyltransferase-2
VTVKPENPERIAIRFPNWIGDAVLATPVLHSMRLGYPESRIDVVAAERVAPIVQSDPHVDHVLAIPNRPAFPGGYLKAAKSIRDGRYDLGLILPDSFGSAFLFFIGGVRRRIGYAAEFRGRLLTEPVGADRNRRAEHLIFNYLRLAGQAGGRSVSPQPEYHTRPEEDKWATEMLTELGITDHPPRIGVIRGATYGPAKRWPADRYRRIIDETAAAGWRVLIFGGKGDIETKKNIFPDNPLSENVHDLVGQTDLRQTAALMKRLDLVLSNDTGPMHLAGSVGTMVIGLFGSTNPVWTGPRGPKRLSIYGSVPCSPCYLRHCPFDLECFKLIDPESVMAALRNSIDNREE